MKTVLTIGVVVVMALFVANSSAKPSPARANAKFQLPDQASDKANPPSKTAVVPLPPPPPIVIPPVVAAFTGGQQSSSAAAAAAVDEATVTIRTRLANSATISIITMTATRLSRRITPLPPVGRAGNMEILKFRFNDRHGTRIGTGNLVCRWASLARRLCWGEARLPRGKLVALGSSQTRVAGEFAVIGGTGVYAFKQGFMTFSPLNRNKFAVRILLA